jgi:hypothetical protein
MTGESFRLLLEPRSAFPPGLLGAAVGSSFYGYQDLTEFRRLVNEPGATQRDSF